MARSITTIRQQIRRRLAIADAVASLRRPFIDHHLAQTGEERAAALEAAALELDRLADVTMEDRHRVEAELLRFVAATDSPQGLVGVARWDTTTIGVLRSIALHQALRELSRLSDRNERADQLARLYDIAVDLVGGQVAEVIAALESDLRSTPRFAGVRRLWARRRFITFLGRKGS